MKLITNFLKAVFNFFVGDWIILSGIALTFLVVWLLLNLVGFSGFATAGGGLLLAGIVLTLVLTLYRETKPARKS